MFIRKFTSIAALSLGAIASLSYADAAHAISFTMSTGTTSPKGEINKGAFTTDKNAIAIDFNNGKAPTTGFAQYSFSNPKGTSKVQNTSWGPVGPTGQKNTSNFLKVDNNSSATISLESLTKSFGLDWGSAQPGNTLSFFNGNTLIQTFATVDIGKFAIYSKSQAGVEKKKGVVTAGSAKLDDGKYYQGNGYVQFFADNANEYFNKIVISQTIANGSFETDNHSFRTVPEPSLVFGMLAIGGGMLLRKRKNQKALNLG